MVEIMHIKSRLAIFNSSTNTNQTHPSRYPSVIAALIIASGFITATGCTSSQGTDTIADSNTANTAPTITGLPQLNVISGELYDFTPTASDADNDELVFEADNLPAWLLIDAATGNLFGIPGFDQLGIYRDILIRVTDGQNAVALQQFNIEVQSPKFSRDNLMPTGTVMDTGDGYTVNGNLTMQFGENSEQTFNNTNLQASFDPNMNLVDLAGEGDLPTEFTDNVALDTGVRADFGLFTGAEINADPSYGAILLGNRQYFLYFLSSGVTLTIQNPAIPAQEITVTAPLLPIPNFIFISDPYDPMVYYGDGGDFAYGMSIQGLLPFRPVVNTTGRVASFEGNELLKGSLGVGFKVFDFLTFTGERVILDPRFATNLAVLNDTLDADNLTVLDFKIGFNGAVAFEFSVLTVGLFGFDIGASSATLEVGVEGVDLAIDALVEPDVSWAPPWMPFVPESQLTADFFANDRGLLDANLSGAFKSTVPAADVEGSIHITLDQVTMKAVVRDRIDIPMSITFGNNETHAKVELDVSFTNEINAAVSSAFDRAEMEVDQAIADVEAAVSGYEIEVSLNGLRTAIPAIADAVIATLNGLPATVRTAVDNAVVAEIQSREECTGSGIFRVCVGVDTLVNEGAIGDTAGNDAKATAQGYVDAVIPVFQELKFQVQQADDESLRVALEQALLAAYDNRTINKTVSGSVSLGSVPVYGSIGSVPYSYNLNVTILNTTNANLILTAADHASKIQASSDLVISSQTILDNLPTQQVVGQVRQQVENGASKVPGVKEVSYDVVSGSYSASVLLSDDSVHTVGFNVLSLDEAIQGISDLLAKYVIERDG